MTTALRVVGFLLLAVMVGCLVLSWRHRAGAQGDLERDRRADRALQRGHVVADEDRPAAAVALLRTLAMAGFISSAFLSQLALHLADDGTSVDGAAAVGLGLTAIGWVGILGLAVRMLTVGRRQGLRPSRPW